MRCPFLREAHATSCHKSAYRKIILRPSERGRELERCSSPAYKMCPEVKDIPTESKAVVCPHLQESLVQFCSAAPSTKFVPYNESISARCQTSDHRYCCLYISLEHPFECGDRDNDAR